MKDKIANWWTYHKTIVLLLIFLSALVLYAIFSFGKKEKTQILSGEIINQVRDEAASSKIENAILKGIGGDMDTETVFVDMSLTMDVNAITKPLINDADTQDSMAKITAYVYAHDLDFMIAEKEIIDYYEGLNAFADLGELLDQEQYTAVADRIYKKDNIAYGVSLKDTDFVKENHITLENPVFAVISGSERRNKAVDMLCWIFKDKG